MDDARRPFPAAADDLRQIALEGLPVLLIGPSEEECRKHARRIHALSERGGPFIVHSCRPLPLVRQKTRVLQHLCARLFASAASGTLYFDRVDRLSDVEQRQLYSVLEGGRYWVPDVDAATAVEFRVVAGAPPGVLQESLLPDLIYRLGVRVIELGEPRA